MTGISRGSDGIHIQRKAARLSKARCHYIQTDFRLMDLLL